MSSIINLEVKVSKCARNGANESKRDFFLERASGSDQNFKQPIFDGFERIGSVTLGFILFCVVSVSLFSIISPHRLHEVQDANFSALSA